MNRKHRGPWPTYIQLSNIKYPSKARFYCVCILCQGFDASAPFATETSGLKWNHASTAMTDYITFIHYITPKHESEVKPVESQGGVEVFSESDCSDKLKFATVRRVR